MDDKDKGQPVGTTVVVPQKGEDNEPREPRMLGVPLIDLLGQDMFEELMDSKKRRDHRLYGGVDLDSRYGQPDLTHPPNP